MDLLKQSTYILIEQLDYLRYPELVRFCLCGKTVYDRCATGDLSEFVTEKRLGYVDYLYDHYFDFFISLLNSGASLEVTDNNHYTYSYSNGYHLRIYYYETIENNEYYVDIIEELYPILEIFPIITVKTYGEDGIDPELIAQLDKLSIAQGRDRGEKSYIIDIGKLLTISEL